MVDRDFQRRMRKRAKKIFDKRSANRRVSAIDGFLLALEVAYGSHQCDDGLSTSFEYIADSCDDPQETIRKHLEDEETKILDIQELHNWPDTFRKQLIDGITPRELSQQGQKDLLETFIILLQAFCQGYTQGWRIEADSPDGSYFHCWCEIYALTTPDGLYLLYCAIDD